MARTILLTNDDGYDAGGLRLLIESLAGLGDLFVSAPTNEQSATSHSLSLRKPIASASVMARSGAQPSCFTRLMNHMAPTRFADAQWM